MKDKIYPAIYESSGGGKYLYENERSYFCINTKEWSVADEIDKRAALSDKNITREYLANTYGEVQSPEHAEFIIELAALYGFATKSPYFKGKLFFSIDRDDLTFWNQLASSKIYGEKKITIPLPPKVSQCNDWPKVGDTVQTSSGKGFVMMAPDNHGLYVIDIKGYHSLLSINELKKPKTPEEEFRDELSSTINESINMDASNNAFVDMLMDKYDIKKKPQ